MSPTEFALVALATVAGVAAALYNAFPQLAGWGLLGTALGVTVAIVGCIALAAHAADRLTASEPAPTTEQLPCERMLLAVPEGYEACAFRAREATSCVLPERYWRRYDALDAAYVNWCFDLLR